MGKLTYYQRCYIYPLQQQIIPELTCNSGKRIKRNCIDGQQQFEKPYAMNADNRNILPGQFRPNSAHLF
ncbi:hypothetical protein XSR1_10282 [Xenorhabdus szentirmaii DSM 16338]|uniref:Uncharacterized protein n=1 Tax=Xenorhabdus szentirmaii DSM 16338 TaxID=1427518 RepID=W1IQX9_9GAMM|nr:hypothetical protein XSR1_10282 [Xenorhabdus szentirmaii DSM 16338]